MTGEPATDPSGTASPLPWHLVVPVKEAGRAKSRLTPPGGWSRPDLARAMAHDTIEVVCRALLPASGTVTVVTSDAEAVKVARGLGADTVADPGHGLDAAVRAGLAHARARAVAQMDSAGGQGAGQHEVVGQHGLAGQQEVAGQHGLAVLLGDLPALRPQDLLAALASCGEHPLAVVPDADGSGTVLLTATRGIPTPQFGPGSAARHAARATRLDLDLPRLRQDVDTADDLARAVELGVGPRTAALLRVRPTG